MHLGLKRNFQMMAGAEWLELLCKHIPDRYEQLVRYCGWYSSRSRGARAAKNPVPATASSDLTEALSEYAQRAKAAWARLIGKVYEADPLACPWVARFISWSPSLYGCESHQGSTFAALHRIYPLARATTGVFRRQKTQ